MSSLCKYEMETEGKTFDIHGPGKLYYYVNSCKSHAKTILQ